MYWGLAIMSGIYYISAFYKTSYNQSSIYLVVIFIESSVGTDSYSSSSIDEFLLKLDWFSWIPVNLANRVFLPTDNWWKLLKS